MTRVGHALLTLVGGACLAVGCSGSTAKDVNFNTDAESGFEPPTREATAETTESDAADNDAQGGAGGAGGAAGGAGGGGGAAGSVADAGDDAVSDGGTG
jgi:hypothetical protein